MGSVGVTMRSPEGDRGSPDTSGSSQTTSNGTSRGELGELVVPSRAHGLPTATETPAPQGEAQLPNAVQPARWPVGLPEKSSVTRVSQGDYFASKDLGSSPSAELLHDIFGKIDDDNIVGAMARALVGAPLLGMRVAAQALETVGSSIVLFFPTTGGISASAGRSVVGSTCARAIGWSVWGIGAGLGYLADLCSHTTRRIFGDTQASWSEALPSTGYPFSYPVREMGAKR